MAKSARRYDIFLPLADNHGVPFLGEQFAAVENQLLARFKGLTSQRREFPFRGIWQVGTEVYSDQIIVLTAIDTHRRGSARFIAQLKAELLRQFEQLEILITETALRIH
jgi:hypothetical protein